MLGSIIGGLASGVLGLIGGQQQNKANAKQVAETNSFNAEEAEKNRLFQGDQAQQQMDFQQRSADQAMGFTENMANSAMGFSERMANTSYQRGMADMKAAGLNPLLAYQQGGASAPIGVSGSGVSAPGASGSGSQASGQVAHMQNVLGPAVSSAIQGAQAVQGLESMEAQIDRTKAETLLAGATARNRDVNSGLQTAQALTEGIRPDVLRAEIGRARAQTSASLSHSALMNAQSDTERERPAQVREETRRAGSQANDTQEEFLQRRAYGTGAAGREAGSVLQMIDHVTRGLGGRPAGTDRYRPQF